MHGKPKWGVYAIVAAFVVVLAAPGTILLASNIGWKINLPLVRGFIAPGPKGDNWVGTGPISPYLTFTNLCNVFVAAGATKANISLAQVNPAMGVVTNVNCAVGSGALLVPGWAIRIRITGNTSPASPTNVVLVGTSGDVWTATWKPEIEGKVEPYNHAGIPTIIGGFIAPGPFGDNWITPPVTTTWVRAQDVCSYIGLGAGQGTVSRIDSTNGVVTTHACGLAVQNFLLVTGESIRIRKVTAGNIDPNSPERPLPWPVY